MVTILLMGTMLSSCNKQDEMLRFEGRVVNEDNEPVSGAVVEVFSTAEDWLTGHNVVVTMRSNYDGDFKSDAIYEQGDYYIFIEKYDTSNWNIRDVEVGRYPTISLPSDKRDHLVEYNSMAAMSNTEWLLTNIHQEYSKPGETAVEWQSIWTSSNNCVRDNRIYFQKDLNMRISEGNIVCGNKEMNIVATFVPPIIFSMSSCEKLPNTSEDVKEFEYSGWPYMENREGKMYMSCNEAVGQLYVYYRADSGKMTLEVYSRQK